MTRRVGVSAAGWFYSQPGFHSTPTNNSPGSIPKAYPGESARGPHENTSLVGVPPFNPLLGACCVCHVIYRDGIAPVSHGYCWTHATTARMREKTLTEVSEEFTR